jgi:hypothetical protein
MARTVERIAPVLLASAINDPSTVIECEVRSYVVTDEREHRNHIVARERVARELWRDMPTDSRTALASLVSEALRQMADNPEKWLETSLVAAGNQTIGISVTFRLGNLDEEVLNLRARRQEIIEQQINDLVGMASEPERSPV